MNTEDIPKHIKLSPPKESESDDYIHTYIQYIHTYNNNNNNKRKRVHTTTTFIPEIWYEFKEIVRQVEDRGVHANHVLEGFMLRYITEHAATPNQPQLTQFFINADQVNIAKEQVVVEKPKREEIDYSKLSLEELQELYDKYTRWGPHKHLGPYSMVIGELKKRGITP